MLLSFKAVKIDLLMCRLKQHLALPKIEPRPPCPPKVYKKLFTFLDGALPTGLRKSVRPSQSTPSSTRPSSQHVRPEKFAKFSNSRKGKESPQATVSNMPSWIMPVIRHMCKKLGALAAPHHVFAGVSSIIPTERRPEDLNIVALMITLFLLVLTRLTGVETGQAEYSQRKKLALEAVEEAMNQKGESMKCNEANIDDYMRQVKTYHWTDMDWFGNVAVGSGLLRQESDSEDPQADDDAGDDDEDRLLPQLSDKFVSSLSEEEDFLQAGLGTMMDERVDYLSDARRRSYDRWKTEMLLKIDELEARDQAAGFDET